MTYLSTAQRSPTRDEALLALLRRQGLSPVMTSRLAVVVHYLWRAFRQHPPDASELADTDDDLACRAADLLAWLGHPGADARTAEGHLRQDSSARRRCSFLYAAVALGSSGALDQIREMVDRGALVTARVIDALAIAGTARDVDRLLMLAARDEERAPLAVLAAGHLGSRPGAQGIADSSLDDAAAKDHARRTILGDDGAAPTAAAPPSLGRLLFGRAWTAADALARRTAPDGTWAYYGRPVA